MSINSKQLKAKIPYEFKIKKQANSNNLTLEQAWSEDKEFTKKAGLECNGSNNECSIPSGSNLNVKVGNQKKEGITSKTGSGKIKMEKDQPGYNQGLKFTISDADVTWSTTSGDAITKLEELETYEITEEGGKYYLTRKTTKEENIRSSLVLPKDCELPTGTEVKTCSLSQENFKKINFDGKSGESFEGQSMSLTISKADSTDFPLGYRFTFKTETEATIKTDTKIKANIPTDFKIKKNTTTPTTLTLEKAWSDFSFAGKVGLECTTGSDTCCTKSSGSVNINVKRGNDKKEGITAINGSGSGKIKVEKEQAGYNQGLKFTITTADVSLTGGTIKSGSDFTKLEELETYEITEEGGKYYLTRKDEASKTIMDLLGLADAGCNISAASCSLSTENIKKVKFDDKDTAGPTASANATLTIAKADNKTDFPLGYKFTLQSNQDITIKNNTNVVKANISTEFKIKKSTTDNASLTLEKAWTPATLGAKVGLNCTTSASGGDECCSMASGSSEKLNVKKESDKKEGITNISGSGKIKVEKDQAGYNKGLKFTIDGGDVTLSGGNKVNSSSDITKLEEYETYEIKEDGGKWYLSRKSEEIVFLKKALGFDFCTDDNIGAIFTCDITDVEKLKKIKFHNMGSFSNWPKAPIKIQLSIVKETTPNNGLKFSFADDSKNSGDSQIKSSSGSWCIPDGAGGSIDLKTSTGGAEYKIKKCNNGGTTTLTLEKKDNSSSTQCTTGK